MSEQVLYIDLPGHKVHILQPAPRRFYTLCGRVLPTTTEMRSAKRPSSERLCKTCSKSPSIQEAPDA